jgi:hypothetical protein
LVDCGDEPGGITGVPEITPVLVSTLNPEGSGEAPNNTGDFVAVIV